jgi:polysaccharide biosynthesis/export protein
MRLLLLVLGLLLPSSAHAQSGAASAEEVTLRPGDVVRVVVWREQDLSGDFPVDEQGVVVFPMLGEVRVAGVPLAGLRDALLVEYRRQLRNPSIQITPLRRVMVLGEVYQPGLKEVDPTLSVAGAVALAGGPTPAGNINNITIIRGGHLFRSRVTATEALDAIDVRSGDQIFVGSRGWVERNSTFLVSTGLSLGLFVVSLLIR